MIAAPQQSNKTVRIDFFIYNNKITIKRTETRVRISAHKNALSKFFLYKKKFRRGI